MSGWRRVTFLGLAMASLAMASLAGCTSTSSPAASSPPSVQTGLSFTAAELCALVSQADMSAALGKSVDPGVPSGVNAPSCTWQDSASSVGATIAADDPDSVGQIPFGLQGISGAHVTAVSGVGDAAFFAAGGTGPTAELDISKGGRAVTITVSISGLFDQAQQEAAELAIGKAAVQKM